MKKYDQNYEDGRCPYGYEFVERHKQGNHWVDSYCRRIPKKRFWNPDSSAEKLKEQKLQESREIAEEVYYGKE